MDSFQVIEELLSKGDVEAAERQLYKIETLVGPKDKRYRTYKTRIMLENQEFAQSHDLSLQLYDDSLTDLEQLTICSCLIESGTILGKFDEIEKFVEKGLKLFSKRNTSTSPHISSREIELLRRLGRMYFVKGDLNEAEKYLNIAIDAALINDNKLEIVSVRNLLAGVEFRSGNLEGSITMMEDVIKNTRELGHDIKLCRYLSNMGLLLHSNGQLEEATNTLQDALSLYEQEDKFDSQACSRLYNNLGNVVFDKGDLDGALRYYGMALRIRQENDLLPFVPYVLSCISKVHFERNELDLAEQYVLQAVELSNEIGIDDYLGDMHLLLIRLYLQKSDFDQSGQYLEKLSVLNEEKKDLRTRQLYSMGKAYYLKSQSRLADILKAQELFSTISKEPIVDYTLTLLAQLNYCDLLLFEFNAMEDIEILDELSQIFSQIYVTAQQYKRIPILIHSLVLQSKIAMLSKNIEKVYTLLAEALEIAIAKNLKSLEQLVKNEQVLIRKQVETWNTALSTNVPINKLVKDTDVREYLSSVARFLRTSES